MQNEKENVSAQCQLDNKYNSMKNNSQLQTSGMKSFWLNSIFISYKCVIFVQIRNFDLPMSKSCHVFTSAKVFLLMTKVEICLLDTATKLT